MSNSYLVDTHCHIHDDQYGFDSQHTIDTARLAGVGQLICIGTTAENSQAAVTFANNYPGMFAAIGLHPHDASLGEDDLEVIARLVGEKSVVAIGEFGLDYHYNNSSKPDQIRALEYQLSIAQSAKKPCVFHVRDAFDDFWPVLDNFPGTRGVIHSFTASVTEVENGIKRGLYFGVNGIATFMKAADQRAGVTNIPLSHLLLETDAPFLTPTPLRGTMNVPANVRLVAAYLAEMRGESLDSLIQATTINAHQLFSLDSSDTI
jgi:TatD DNase family protein